MSPLAIFQDAQNNLLELKCSGIFLGEENIQKTWGIMANAWAIILFSLLAIYTYKNRKRQITLCVVNIILFVVFYVGMAAYSYAMQAKLGISFEAIQYGSILPTIALIFNVLALIKIKADEKLVRSLDRIR